MWNLETCPVDLFMSKISSQSGSARSVGEAFVFSVASSSYSTVIEKLKNKLTNSARGGTFTANLELQLVSMLI